MAKLRISKVFSGGPGQTAYAMVVLQFAVKLSEQIIPIMSQVFLAEQLCVCKAWQDLDKRLSNYACFRPSKKIRYTGMDIIILSEIAAFLLEPIF